MNSLEVTLPRLPLPKGAGEKPAYIAGVTCLLLLWAVYAVLTALLLVAVFSPGHLGLSDWLRALANLWPEDYPMFST
jgi:hypothetical protein